MTSASHFKPSRWAPWLLAATILALSVLWVFGPTIHHGWAPVDDELNFLENPHYRGFTSENLRWMWTTRLAGHYIPLSWMTLAADFERSGMNPHGYHATNVALHLGNALLFFALAARLLRGSRPWPRALGAFVAAAFFAVHPLRVESVAWITERRDLLCGFFVLLSVLAYLAAIEAGGRRSRRSLFGTLSLLAFVAALLAKGIAVALPCALVALDAWLGRIDFDFGGDGRAWFARTRAVWIEKIPYFALAVGFAASTFWAISPVMVERAELGLQHRLLAAGFGLWFYLEKTLVPWAIPFEIPWTHRLSVANDPAIALRGLGFLALWGIAWGLRRRVPALVGALAVYTAFVLPVSGLFQAGPQLAAHRYTYLATLPLGLILGLLTARGGAWTRSRGRRAAFGAIALVVVTSVAVVGLAQAARAQVDLWRDDLTFSRAAAAGAPDAWAPIARLARAHLGRAEPRAALDVLRAGQLRLPAAIYLRYLEALVLATSPDPQVRDGDAAFELARGLVAETRGQDPAALLALAAAIAEQGDLAAAHRGLASAKALAFAGRKANLLPLLEEVERRLRARGRLRFEAVDWRELLFRSSRL